MDGKKTPCTKYQMLSEASPIFTSSLLILSAEDLAVQEKHIREIQRCPLIKDTKWPRPQWYQMTSLSLKIAFLGCYRKSNSSYQRCS
ncbi:hypothetical protein CDAR_192381 [Caerostris darwini]|uniref:Uncharacterized protein n=1 Tax=Caerostris darwini TaxID=1538125 RepID=A0AAV4PKU2_9ARAC|nr:hypothetical protein CDAR_192381 [Caerostris darwini]